MPNVTLTSAPITNADHLVIELVVLPDAPPIARSSVSDPAASRPPQSPRRFPETGPISGPVFLLERGPL